MGVKNPLRIGVYRTPLLLIHLVIELVLLKKSLYCGNNFWIYLVDLVVDNFVSQRTIIVGA